MMKKIILRLMFIAALIPFVVGQGAPTDGEPSTGGQTNWCDKAKTEASEAQKCAEAADKAFKAADAKVTTFKTALDKLNSTKDDAEKALKNAQEKISQHSDICMRPQNPSHPNKTEAEKLKGEAQTAFDEAKKKYDELKNIYDNQIAPKLKDTAFAASEAARAAADAKLWKDQACATMQTIKDSGGNLTPAARQALEAQAETQYKNANEKRGLACATWTNGPKGAVPLSAEVIKLVEDNTQALTDAQKKADEALDKAKKAVEKAETVCPQRSGPQ